MMKKCMLAVLLAATLLLVGCRSSRTISEIDMDAAKNIALSELGISSAQAEELGVRLLSRDGLSYYCVEITLDGRIYSFDIDPISGVVIARSSPGDTTVTAPEGEQTETATLLTQQEAFEIAYTDAGYTAAHVYMTSCELVETEESAEYEIRFVGASGTHRYIVDARTGEVLLRSATTANTSSGISPWEDEIDPDMNVSPSTAADGQEGGRTSSDGDVTPSLSLPQLTRKVEDAQKALSIALSHAGLNRSRAVVYFCTYVTEYTGDSIDTLVMMLTYDIYFSDREGVFYHYEIDAMSGEVKSVTTSRDLSRLNNPLYDATEPVTLPSDAISGEMAIRIAMTGRMTRATVIACQPDCKAGVFEYDVMLQSADGKTWYVCEVDAVKGTVISTHHLNNSISTMDGDDAISIALWQVSGANISHIQTYHIRLEDGRMEYEGVIVFEGMRYEFVIDSYSGAIREWKAEPVGS